MQEEEKLYTIALSRVDGIGGIMFRQLINMFGTAEEVFNASSQKLLKIPNFGKATYDRLKQNTQAFAEAKVILEKSEKENIRTITFKDDDYPKRLKQIYEAPPILYTKGNGKLEYEKTLAIVGTREASDYGKKVTEEIIEGLAGLNIQVISGLAYGIDIAAHKAALKHKVSTVAVLANSLDSVYPAMHKKYAQEILEDGLLMSENPYGSKLAPAYFISRNRIIAGLSDVVLVVESAKKGGSMVTAEFANNYNRDVFAIPGSVYQKFSEGPNYLVQTNKAQIFSTTEDLAAWMQWGSNDEGKKAPKLEREIDLASFTLDESKVLSVLMQKGEVMIDELSWQSQVPLNKLASILLNLEFQDLVVQSPGKKFKLK
jgi:DNA processing protein